MLWLRCGFVVNYTAAAHLPMINLIVGPATILCELSKRHHLTPLYRRGEDLGGISEGTSLKIMAASKLLLAQFPWLVSGR